MWIDRIVIDQDNVTEKNAQVAKMSDIFRRAESAALCIGTGNALSCLLNAATLGGEELRQAIKVLGAYAYWYRTWIVQELVLPRHLSLNCGSDTMDWAHFQDLIIQVYPREITAVHEELNHSETIPQLLRLVRRRIMHEVVAWDPPSSARLLYEACILQCSDLRDKVYAMLALIHSDDDILNIVKPDYSQSKFSLFLKLQHYLKDLFFDNSELHLFNILTALLEAFGISIEDEEVEA